MGVFRFRAVLSMAVVSGLFTVFAGSRLLGQTASAPAMSPTQAASAADMVRLCALLNVEPILKRPAYNYDESKANPFPKLPEALVLKNGEKVTDAQTWWEKRRPEILEDFEREVYGRRPKDLPKVTWEVTATTPGKVGEFATVTKTLVGHVDNASDPAISVTIQAMLTIPANASGPVPVMIQFSGFGFGFPGGRGPVSAGGARGRRGRRVVRRHGRARRRWGRVVRRGSSRYWRRGGDMRY